MFAHVYLSLPLFTRAYLFSTLYSCFFTYFYQSLRAFTYDCYVNYFLRKFTYDYSSLTMFTTV